MPTQKAPSFVQTTKHVKTPRPSIKTVEHPIPADNLRKDIPKSRGHINSRNRKACFVCKSLTHLIKDCDYYEKKTGNPQHTSKDKGVIKSGYSRHMTWNLSYLSDFEEINGGYVAFGGNPKGGKITGKGKIRTGKLDFDDVYFVKELKFNLFSVSQICDKKNNVLFTDTECIVLSSDFKLLDENHGKSASTPIVTEKPLLMDPDGEDVDVHTYRSVIGTLMYLTSSRPDIMFAVYACARFQVTPKASHLHAVKRIFRYLKGKPHLGLWYLKDSPFNLVAYSDSDYAGASLDRKSTTGGCQFLGCRLISWQCKKQTVVATSSTEAEYVMGYEKPSTKLTFYKAFFSAQWKFLIHTILQCMSAKRTAWNEFSSFMASAVICLATDAQVGDLSSQTTKYTSPALTQKQEHDDIADDVADDKIAQALEITKLKQKVRKLEKKSKLKVYGLKRLRKVGTTQRVKSSADTVMDDQEDASKQGEIAELDADEDVTLEEVANDAAVLSMHDDEAEPAELKEVIKVVTTAKLMTEVVTAAATTITAAPITTTPSAARRRKGMSYDDIRPIFEKHFNSIVGFLEKSEKELEEEARKALKRKSKSVEQQVVKKQKLDEEVPVIDYQIHTGNNKPYYKIIRADGTHQLFLSFISLLKNFDREDLYMLWQIVQKRFASSKPYGKIKEAAMD
nr:uncharacterized mitochondrial protein AtMg00810-like [Tanacetum cinerariifolium]